MLPGQSSCDSNAIASPLMPVIGAVLLGAEPREEMPQQMRDVVAPHPQRRDRQRQHVQAIEQVFAELPGL